MSDVKNSGLATGLVSYWELEEASGTRVDSHGSNDLTDNNTVGQATGIQGNGADFEDSNSEYLSITDASQSGLGLTGDFTISAWVKPESILPGDGNRPIVDKNNCYSLRLERFTGTFNNNIVLIIWGTSGICRFKSTTQLSVGTWYHIVASFDASASSMEIYINGTEEGVSVNTGATNVRTLTEFFSIGGTDYMPFDSFDGIIDEVGVWNRILTSSEATALYNSGAGIPYEAATSTQSVRVYSDAGLSTELAREIVSASEMHVKIPTLTSSTQIWVDYDGVRADYAVGATYGRNAVWSDYHIVWHMGDLTSSTIQDSTGNWNGTKVSSGNPSETASGFIGEAQDFSNDYIKTVDNVAHSITGVKSLQTWVRFDALTRVEHFPGIKTSLSSTRDATLSLNDQGTADRIVFYQFDGAVKTLAHTSAPSTSVWYMAHGTYDGTNMRLYIDGSLSGTLASGDSFNHGANANITVGHGNPNCQLDEVRYRESPLSANWITTEYNNQNDEASFWGTWTDAGGGSTANNSARRMLLMQM